MMEGKTLSTEKGTANIYFSLYLCSGSDTVQDKTCLGDINSKGKHGLSFALVAREVQDFAVEHPVFASVETATFLRFHIVTLNLARTVYVQLFCYHMLTYPTPLNCVLTNGLYCLLVFCKCGGGFVTWDLLQFHWLHLISFLYIY